MQEIGRMEGVEAREPPGALKDRARAWRPWQLKEFELFEGVAVSTPSRRHFSRGYYLLAAIGSGESDNRYRKTAASDHGGDGVFRVFEPEETWICQPRNATFRCLTVDPGWLHETAAAMLTGSGRCRIS